MVATPNSGLSCGATCAAGSRTRISTTSSRSCSWRCGGSAAASIPRGAWRPGCSPSPAGGRSTACSPEAHRFGSVGKPFPGVEVKIADDGELLIKGPNIFQGYHNRTEESFGAVEDGWLHTGDLGRIDEDGFVYIVGRKKDIIITAGGKNLTPANIENDLKQCRGISHAVMHGDQRPY